MQFANGELKFKIADLFKEMLDRLSEEERREFLEDLFLIDEAYLNFIYKAREIYSAPHCNSDYFRLFKDFFLAAPEFSYPGKKAEVINTMSIALGNLIHEMSMKELENRRLRTGRYDFLRNIKANIEDYDEPITYDTVSRIYDECHNVNDKYVKATLINEEFDYKKLTTEWVEALYGAFEHEGANND